MVTSLCISYFAPRAFGLALIVFLALNVLLAGVVDLVCQWAPHDRKKNCQHRVSYSLLLHCIHFQIGDGTLVAQRVRTFAVPLCFLAWAWHAFPIEVHQAGDVRFCHWWAVGYALILHCLICEWWRLRHTKGAVAAFADWPWCALLVLAAFPAS